MLEQEPEFSSLLLNTQVECRPSMVPLNSTHVSLLYSHLNAISLNAHCISTTPDQK